MKINFNEYTEAAYLFANKECKFPLQHYLLGIGSEVGEIGSCLKKEIAYGKDVDVVNLGEEIGDLFWFMSQFIREHKNVETNNGANVAPAFYQLLDNFHIQINGRIYHGKYQNNVILAYDIWVALLKKASKLIEAYQDRVYSYDIIRMIYGIRDEANSLAKIYSLDMDNILRANINKLTQRYGGTVYSQNAALFRNLGVEYNVLKDNL